MSVGFRMQKRRIGKVGGKVMSVRINLIRSRLYPTEDKHVIFKKGFSVRTFL